MKHQDNRRILLIDDNEDIHRDFCKILATEDGSASALSDAEDALFGEAPATDSASPAAQSVVFEIASAMQGQEAFEFVQRSVAEAQPYALAFVDMRMPPGWDGIETIRRLWELDADLQIVICTAFADYTWTEMISALGRTDKLLILKKPFDAIEVSQLALAMTEKWNTTRRMREEMHAAERAELEARAYAASLETVNTALELAKVSAEAAASAHSEFLVSVTGGILDPMTRLVDRAETVRSLEAGGESWSDLLDEVCADGSRLAASLKDVLDLAEIEAGTLTLSPAPCSPGALAEAVCARHRARAEAKGLTLSLERTPAAPPQLETDGARLERVLEHLISNAVTYTETGSVAVTVDGDAQVAGRAHFHIIDSGPGLSAEGKHHLFESFCHAPTDADPRHGAGLGLSLSKRLARVLGGELEVETSEAGTRLTLSVTAAIRSAG